MKTVTFPGFHIAVNVKDIAFRVFGWPIHWYGIIIAVGFLLAVWYCTKVSDRYGIKEDDIIDMLLYAVPLCIIGARLYYVIFYLDLYRKTDGSLNFPAMVRIWDGGLAIYGAIITAIVVVAVFCKKRKLNFFAFADMGSLGVMIGQLVGRWGNFVNVEAYGSETTMPWRMGIYDTVDGVYRYLEVHPTFLYESLWNLAGFLVLALFISKRRKFDGQIFWMYMGWYGLGRFWIESLRTDSLYLFTTGLRVSQVLALSVFLVSTVILLLQLRRPHKAKDLWVNRLKAKAATEAVPETVPPAGEETAAVAQATPSVDDILKELREEDVPHDPT